MKDYPLRDDQAELIRDAMRYVRDQAAERTGNGANYLLPVDRFALRRTKERLDEVLKVFETPAMTRERVKLVRGGKTDSA
jgi:hypothetical protein